MLLRQTWTQTPVPIFYSWGFVGCQEGPGCIEAQCDFVRVRCGKEQRVAVHFKLTFRYDMPVAGVLTIDVDNAPDALRAGLIAMAREGVCALPDAVSVGARRDYAGLDLSGLELLSAETRHDRPSCSFTVGPVRLSEVEAFLRDQAEEAQEQTEARAWAASG